MNCVVFFKFVMGTDARVGLRVLAPLGSLRDDPYMAGGVFGLVDSAGFALEPDALSCV